MSVDERPRNRQVIKVQFMFPEIFVYGRVIFRRNSAFSRRTLRHTPTAGRTDTNTRMYSEREWTFSVPSGSFAVRAFIDREEQ